MTGWAALPATVILAVHTALAPTPSPAPSAALPPAAETTLKEIGTVKVTNDICKPLLVSAGAAVDYMLDDNVKLGQAIARMRNIDLDSNILLKTQGAHELMDRFVSMRKTAAAGKAEMQKFRAEAQTVTDPKQREALLSFANAMAGALERQTKLAYDISRLAVFVDSHPPIDEWDLAELQIELQRANVIQSVSDGPLVPGYPYNIPQTLSQVSADSAEVLQERAEPMFGDENDASKRIEPAFSGC
jgi:hypothetical protein